MQHPLTRFHFCPACGSPHFEIYDFKSKRCADCGFTYYHNASAATVAVIFNQKNELLTVRRALEPARGTLDLPGGFVDSGETLEEGCLREVEEELGAKADIERYLFSLPNVYNYSNFDVHTVDSFFLCRLHDEALPLAARDDAEQARFIALDEIRPDDFGLTSISQGIRKILQLKHP